MDLTQVQVPEATPLTKRYLQRVADLLGDLSVKRLTSTQYALASQLLEETDKLLEQFKEEA